METADNKDSEPTGSEENMAKASEEPKPRTSGLKGTRALRKLRDRVERAALELIRLREENASLQQRIEEMEATPVSRDNAGLLLLDTDPKALKRKVEGFIQSIDDYLEKKEPSK